MSELSSLLASAWRSHGTVAIPGELVPADFDAAFSSQHCLLDALGDVAGGWKVGAKTPDGPAQGAPLPSAGIHHTGAVLERNNFPVLGLELEIAFSFGRGFSAADAEMNDADILGCIESMRTSIEIVSSRLGGWPQAPQLTQLADLQNHGALVIGDAITYRPDFPFDHPVVRFAIGEQSLFLGEGSNPAGDPRRLLPWVVRHCMSRGLLLPAGSIVTTGTFVGAHFVADSGVVVGEIEGLPPLRFSLI